MLVVSWAGFSNQTTITWGTKNEGSFARQVSRITAQTAKLLLVQINYTDLQKALEDESSSAGILRELSNAHWKRPLLLLHAAH